MKIFLILVITLVALVGLILFIGASLSRKHSVSREMFLPRPPVEVYAVLRDFANLPSWRTNVTRVEILEPVDGRFRFREHSKQGVVNYEVLEDVPGQKMVTQIVDRNLGYSGSWTYELIPKPGGTLMRITENGDVPNVLFRFMSRFVFGYTKTIETYLADLSAKLK